MSKLRSLSIPTGSFIIRWAKRLGYGSAAIAAGTVFLIIADSILFNAENAPQAKEKTD